MKSHMTSRPLLVLLLIATIVVPSAWPNATRAAGWAEIDSPTSRTLFGIDVSGDTLYAVGENGTVAYSDDGGDTWQDGDSDVTDDLYDVSAISSTKAVAVGESGTVIRTIDGGENWTEIEPDMNNAVHSDYDLRSVRMASSTVGFAVGQYGVAIKTTDGGASWDEIDGPTGSLDESLNSVAFSSASILWVAGEDGVIFKTTDGGTTWNAQTSGTGENLVTIEFSDSSNGWAVGDNRTFLRTTNGGTTWTDVEVSGIDSTDTISDVSFLNDDDGILTTNDGTMLETDDAGDSWSEADVSGSPVFIDLLYVSSSERWGVGDEGSIGLYDATLPSKPSNFDVAGDNDDVTDSTPTFTWTASTDGQTEIDYYKFKIDSGSYANVGNVTSKTYGTSLDDGEHTAYVYAVDLAGNSGTVASLSFTVNSDANSTSDVDVSSVTPTTAVKNDSVIFSVRLENGIVEECDLYVDGDNDKSMTVKTDVAYATRTFTANGTYNLHARCTDENGETVSGAETEITVSTVSSYAEPGDIIKIGCTGDVYVNDPCTAVYYYGDDGKRHAFPNEKVFNTWFSDFDDLVVLSSSAMSDIALGRNVVYRPGMRLVKFTTSAVYAVSYAGILRPIANGEIAEAIFGDDWISLIDSVDDTFYGNYRVGSDIESSSDYSASAAKSATSTIDATF